VTGIRITRLNHVALPISDRRKTLPFYRDLLGLKVIPSMVDNPSVVWTVLEDGAMVHPVEPNAEGQPAVFHVAFEVADFDSAVRALEQAGVEISRQGVRHDGQRFLFVNDPDGNRIELATGAVETPSNRVVDEWGHTTVV
jgi:metallothiol transferase